MMTVCQTVNLCQNVNAGHATEGVLEPLLDTSEFMKPVAMKYAKSVLAVDTNSIQPSITCVLCVDLRSMIRPVVPADVGSVVLDVVCHNFNSLFSLYRPDCLGLFFV